MRITGRWTLFTLVALAAGSATATAQTSEPATREAVVEQAQAEKATRLTPYVPSRAEQLMGKVDDILTRGGTRWYPFFDNAYAGGGFALGPAYKLFVSPYNTLDVRGSYSIRNYKLAEAEFIAPELFKRRGKLVVNGGWREATQVGFFGVGNETSKDDRVNYGFEQPFASALLTVHPTRRYFTLRGGLEWVQWKMQPGQGSSPSIETAYQPETLPGVGANVKYMHSQAMVGFDWRPAIDYARRGGYLGVIAHDYADRDDAFGFGQVDYEAIQHIPILREAWVISLHGHLRTTTHKSGQQVPFFLLPWLGGGHSVRGVQSFRFRDENSLLVQAEWRIMVNRFLDTAFFYDAGKVAPHVSEFDTKNLTECYGFGVRFHTPFSTPFRVDVAKSTEAWALVFASKAVF
jgi:surface antigen Omp85-like protein